MFEILLVKNDASKKYDITPIVQEFSWDSKMSLTSIIDIAITESSNVLMPVNPVEVGDLVVIFDNEEEITRGIIVEETRQGTNTVSYIAFDYAWYLGQSKSVYQFNAMNARLAIIKILNDFGIPIGEISQMVSLITAVYVQKTPAEIIKEILTVEERQTGKKYFSEIIKGRLYITEMKEMVIIGKFKLAGNLDEFNVTSNPLGIERTKSIKKTRNRIKLIISPNSNFETVALEQDNDLVSKYGLLEETYKIDEADVSKARQAAKILLKRAGRVHETNKISLMGDSSFKAGRLFDIDDKKTGMKNRFMITECKHMVQRNSHYMDLVLTLQEDVS